MKKVRQSNFELMRIISMIFIIIYHIIFHGKLLQNTTGTIKIVLTIMLFISLIHVNSFVILSGYFKYDKDFSIKSFFKTFNAAWFYKILFASVLLFTGIYELSKVQYLKSLNPFDLAGYWFIACYLIMDILSPFINILIKNMNQKTHRKLIITSIFCFSIFSFLSSNTFGSNDGFTVIQFIILYFIGAYLAKYPIENNTHFKNYSKNKLQLLLLVGFIFFIFINYLFYNFGITLENQTNQIIQFVGNQITNYTMHYNCIFVLIQTICYFLLFKTFTINSKIINFIGKLTLGVYLVHDNPYIQVLIYKYLRFDTGDVLITSPKIIIKVLVFALGIFIVSAFIEYIRQLIFKFIKKLKISKNLTNKFYDYIDNF